MFLSKLATTEHPNELHGLELSERAINTKQNTAFEPRSTKRVTQVFHPQSDSQVVSVNKGVSG